MVKKQVRGLLDYTSVNNDGDLEFAPLSEDATRWAFKGYMLELHQNLASFKKRLVGKGSQNSEA